MGSRFAKALAAYLALALLAFFTLEGSLRLITLVWLAGLAIKTWLVQRRRKQEE